MLPMFVAVLAFFHFMEFWITARFNTRKAEVKGMFPVWDSFFWRGVC